MATIKSFTDVQQSKMLAEILPLESADMCYLRREINDTFIETPIVKPKGEVLKSLPCWSLAALLELLKEQIIFGGNSPEGWFCCYTIKNPTKTLTIYGDSLVDACVAMIEKLKGLKML